jgi:hypothetical protein
MTTISAKSILASKHAITGARIDTLLLRNPRWIHAEGRTHRLMKIGEDMEISVPTPSLMEDENLSRNASSSRAIPVEKLIQDVLDDPAVPLFWGLNKPGMQAAEHTPCVDFLEEGRTEEELDCWVTFDAEEEWLLARDEAVDRARRFAKAGYHKQIVNRLLEPFSHITVVVTATNWSNFLALRDHPDAEPHIQILAREIRKALEGADVQVLQPGEWHLPFLEPADYASVKGMIHDPSPVYGNQESWLRVEDARIDAQRKLSVARCASTSYRTVDGFDMTLERAIELHDKLLNSNPMHASPFEHQAQADELRSSGSIARLNGEWLYEHPHQHGNFTGFRQYRKMLPGECQ